MRRSILTVMVVACGLVVSGCAELKQLRNQNAALNARLTESGDERDDLSRKLRLAESGRGELERKLGQAQSSEERLAKLLSEQEVEKQALEREKQGLRELIADIDIEGITTRSGPEGNVIELPNRILFALGEAALSNDAKKALDAIVDYLKKLKGQKIRIDGHTDGVPIVHTDWKDNYHLAAMRAHAVMSYLASKGIPGENMYLAGFGPNRPKVTPKSKAEPVAENRRVELLLVPERSGALTTDIGAEF